MRVLLISLFHPELVRGGAQQICYELFQGLKEQPDLDVTLLAAVDSTQGALFKSGARITGFDGRDEEFVFLSQGYEYTWHKVASPLHVRAMAEFLEELKPDVVHFHHFMLIGIDMVALVRRLLPDCRIVFTFHEFMAMCSANGHMVRTFNGALCTLASPVRCHQCFPDRPPEHFFMRQNWFKQHLSKVDCFAVPSHFMIDHYVRWGLDAAKLRHVTNGQNSYNVSPRLPPTGRRPNRFGFFGQLVDAKGVQIILEAVQILREQGFTDFQVDINGDNLRYASPEIRATIEEAQQIEQAKPLDERAIFFRGSYQSDDLAGRMARVDWVIVPSVWWEIFCLVISEAWMFGKPVIASDVGGPAERIADDVNGLLFNLGDAEALAAVMRRACEEEGLWARLVEALPPPPARAEMVAGYREAYGLPPEPADAGSADAALVGRGSAETAVFGTSRSTSRSVARIAPPSPD